MLLLKVQAQVPAAEWKNRHQLNVAHTLLIESSVPSEFWVEALSTAVHLIYRLLPSQKLKNESPYFHLYKSHPSYKPLHTVGCICFVHLSTRDRNKLSSQSVRCAFLGYASHQNGYLCFDPSLNRIRVSRNVVFFENQFFFP